MFINKYIYKLIKLLLTPKFSIFKRRYPLDFKSNIQDVRQDVLDSGFSNNKLLPASLTFFSTTQYLRTTANDLFRINLFRRGTAS